MESLSHLTQRRKKTKEACSYIMDLLRSVPPEISLLIQKMKVIIERVIFFFVLSSLYFYVVSVRWDLRLDQFRRIRSTVLLQQPQHRHHTIFPFLVVKCFR